MSAPTFALAVVIIVPALGADEPNRSDAGLVGPEERFEALKREQQEEQRAFREEIAGEEFNSEPWRRIYFEHVRRRSAFGERALELAREHPDDPLAVDALLWILGCSPEAKERAFQRLASDYIDSEKIDEACRSASRQPYPSAGMLLRKAMAESPHRTVRGTACYMLGDHLEYHARLVGHLEENPEKAGELASQYDPEEWRRITSRSEAEHLEEAERCYERIIAEYADVVFENRFGVESLLGDRAEGQLFRIRHLSVGRKAPEIEGEDVEGERFRLGDYRGRVVVLTFSGDWCGPCRAMYPHERQLADRLKDRPFALLSVNTDADRETLREAISSGEITWRCWWDGGTSGPIATRWGIDSYPTIFVIDGEGVIRHKNLRGPELDEAVDRLLAESARP